MKRGGYIIIAALAVLACTVIYTLQQRLDVYKGKSPHIGEFMRLPDAGQLKVASLGYESLVADVLWLKTVQHMGEKTISGEGYDWIYKALDTVTTLDPEFLAPYEVGGLILTILAEKTELSNRLLEKGVKHCPDVWQLKLYLGFNHFYFLKDYKTAAHYISQAAAIKGSPPYLPVLASRLYVQADDPAYALEFLMRMYESTEDKKLRYKMKKQIDLLKSEVLVRELQKIADLYKERTHSQAHDLNELVRTGFLRRIPEGPGGGYFYVDGSGMVRSSKLKPGEELGVYLRNKGR